MSFKVDQNVIGHVAKLANLSLSSEEADALEGQLGRIFAHIEEITKITAATNENVYSDGILAAHEREDVPSPSLAAEIAISQAPAKIGTAFQVPRIIDLEG